MNTLSKTTFSVIPGAIVTFLLLIFMVSLIVTGNFPVVESSHQDFTRIFHIDAQVVPQADSHKVDKPAEPANQPDRLPEIVSHPQVVAAPFDDITPIGPAVGDPTRPGIIDTDYIPVYVPQPRFPNKAATRGINGYAVVELTITTTGSTREARIIEEFPQGYGFGKSALKAADKIKYNPRVVNGEAREVEGVTYKFSFKIE